MQDIRDAHRRDGAGDGEKALSVAPHAQPASIKRLTLRLSRGLIEFDISGMPGSRPGRKGFALKKQCGVL